jgi:hypothetical protein
LDFCLAQIGRIFWPNAMMKRIPPDMTKDTTAAAEAIFGNQSHIVLTDWLRGKGIDDAHKAMNRSAVSKKPGRVIKRVGKPMSGVFSTPRVISWEKEKKTVYAAGFSQAEVSEVVMDGTYAVPTGVAAFQTDLYFRANKKVTEVNASTVAGISQDALEKLVLLRPEGEESAHEIMQVALTLARIFQTGLKDSNLPADTPFRFLVPNGEDAMVVLGLPILRIEFGEELVGKVALISDVIPAADISEQDRVLLDEMKTALTREGHPGADAFAEMVAARACPLDIPQA